MTNFICISGHAQNGKDTSACIFKSELESRGFRTIIVHYADLLKFICKAFFGWDGKKDERGRSLLQRIGTECVRKKNPDYWVEFVTKIVSMFPGDWEYIIIPDVRFPNELSGVLNAGFPVTHVRIVRDGFQSPLTEEQQNHPSETALDNSEPDYWLHNRTIEGLRDDIRKLCDRITARNHAEPVQLSIFDIMTDIN